MTKEVKPGMYVSERSEEERKEKFSLDVDQVKVVHGSISGTVVRPTGSDVDAVEDSEANADKRGQTDKDSSDAKSGDQ